MIKKGELITTTIRIPEELRKWLKIRAIKNNRSFNSELIEIFEKERDKEKIDNDQI